MRTLSGECVSIFLERIASFKRVSIGVFAIATLIALLLPSTYRSSAGFALTMPRTTDPSQCAGAASRDRILGRLRELQAASLSKSVLEKAAERLHPGADPREISGVVETLRTHLAAALPKEPVSDGSGAFSIACHAPTARGAAETAKAVASAFLESHGRAAREAADRSRGIIARQLEELNAGMEEKENALARYESENALLPRGDESPPAGNGREGPDFMLTRALSRLQVLRERLGDATAEIEFLEKEVSGKGVPALPGYLEKPGRAAAAFKNKAARLQIELNEMSPRFPNRFARYRRVQRRLKKNVQSLKEELKRIIKADKVNTKGLRTRIRETENTAVNLRRQIQAEADRKSVHEHLKREYALAKDAYGAARAQLERERMVGAESGETVSLVEAPETPVSPYKPNRLLLILLGALGGIIVAAATVVLQDVLDPSIRRPEQIERLPGIEFLGATPEIK
jgi:uncharacterized protein involved in exopolysaccharide biosynthesis